jgi:hypothetical protein
MKKLKLLFVISYKWKSQIVLWRDEMRWDELSASLFQEFIVEHSDSSVKVIGYCRGTVS